MRNVTTREGYEFWDKICAVQSYAFLLSPDGRRVVKTPDIGDWIDKHDAQVIVDHAQEEFNVMKAERDALQLRLNAADQRVDELEELLGTSRVYITDLAGSLENASEFFEGSEEDDPQATEECEEARAFAMRIHAALNPAAEAASHEE